MFMYKTMFFTFLVMGTFITASSYTWLGMWMGLEINLLSFIPLISKTKNKLATETAIKYFITQVLASTVILFTMISMSFKQMYMPNIETWLNIMFSSALLMKMGAAPFHFWFPEIIEGMSWNNTLMLLTWQKIAPMTMFIYIKPALMFLLSIIIWSMMISGIFGLNQISMRKILVYSSINHIGWMILPMAYNEMVWFYYMIIYMIMNFNIIMILKMINISNLNQMNIMNKKLNIKILFMLNFLSLGGMPPLIGFMPKWMTIQMMIQNNLFLLSLMMMMMTMMTLYFYTRITLSTLTLTTEENFWMKKKLSSFMIMFLNMITISSLFLCTLSFNFL